MYNHNCHINYCIQMFLICKETRKRLKIFVAISFLCSNTLSKKQDTPTAKRICYVCKQSLTHALFMRELFFVGRKNSFEIIKQRMNSLSTYITNFSLRKYKQDNFMIHKVQPFSTTLKFHSILYKCGSIQKVPPHKKYSSRMNIFYDHLY